MSRIRGEEKSASSCIASGSFKPDHFRRLLQKHQNHGKCAFNNDWTDAFLLSTVDKMIHRRRSSCTICQLTLTDWLLHSCTGLALVASNVYKRLDNDDTKVGLQSLVSLTISPFLSIRLQVVVCDANDETDAWLKVIRARISFKLLWTTRVVVVVVNPCNCSCRRNCICLWKIISIGSDGCG